MTISGFCTLGKMVPLHHSIMMFVCLILGLRHCVVSLSFRIYIIVGIKVWTLICPDYAEHLYDSNGLLPKTINSAEPRFKSIAKAREVAMTVFQYPGETIFVPSGWHHQVVNQGYGTLVAFI